ncbi:PQ loop repeat-domain-containing protein [Cerioporus squamosus]|nr:PQ loop repeat-domain-containing protein [Cerioporus squamosus]
MLLSAGFSELLGYTSIACWLGAQFPQVLENARRQSVEGLALPFLLNWLLGDTTNLIGCILTHQLPFQTYLATYFCVVDFSLLAQYYYYMSRTEKNMRPPYLHSRDRTTPSTIAARRLSLDRGPSAPHYRALSNVAANVAAVAALAAQQEEQARWHGRSHSTEPHPTTYDEDDVSEEALARLAESFHSEGGRSSRRKHVVWGHGSRGPSVARSRQSSHMPTSLQMSMPPTEEADPLTRGRPLVRAADREDDGEEWLNTTSQRRSSRASRKGATMVFLGVWALFGVGSLASGRSPLSTGLTERTGQVLARAAVSVLPPVEPPLADSILSAQLTGEPAVFEFAHPLASVITLADPDDRPSTEFIVGRISAWICTTLYLTSRLPQIWKNYVRKSVEGLSVYLFIFAFLGNFFYVASILTSPNLQLPEPQADAFIRESIPYLLGSGGTLMFDVTIVTQAFLYSHKAARGRRPSHSYNEEEAGLLAGEAIGRDASPVTSRRRGGSISRDASVGFS